MKREASFIVIVWSIFYFLAVAPVALEGEANSEDKFFIEKRWSTGRIFKIPESIKFDSDRERIYVANINGRSNSKDGNGFISIISLEGEVVELKWIEGLNAPKGMGIYGGKLFVADIDEVVEIDIEDEKIVERYGAGGAQFLNDVDIDSDGNVYISDTSRGNSVIYRLSEGKLGVWLKDDDIISPNGLYVNEGTLMVGNSGDGKLKAVRIEDRSIEVIADVESGIDGLEMDGDGNFIISDWRGKTRLVEPDGSVTLLCDTSEKKINSADIEFIMKEQLILIPTFMDNRVVAVELKKMIKE